MGADRIANVLTIAGVDPSGGAGVLADVKAMSALGAYAAAVVTALTAQNTRAVTGILPVPPEFVSRQIDTLFEDVRVDAVKIGMLGDEPVIRAVAERLRFWKPRWVVLDPVMVAKSGDRLLAARAVDALIGELLPLADVLTPNLPEAGDLLGHPVGTLGEMRSAARELQAMVKPGAAVVLKGGHLSGDGAVDIFFDGERLVELPARRIPTGNTHGTGCTMSSAIAALLPQRPGPLEAVRDAKDYLTDAITASGELDVGHGHGPVHHFSRLWAR